MRLLFKVFSVLLVIFVLLFSFGINVSKMKCAEGTLFLGTNVPSCHSLDNFKNNHQDNQQEKKLSCCKTIIDKLCCLDAKKGCEKESKFIHFSFLFFSQHHNIDLKKFSSQFLIFTSPNFNLVLDTFVESFWLTDKSPPNNLHPLIYLLFHFFRL